MLRAVFESPDVARAFFSAFLPSELVKRLDLTHLEARPDHLIDPRLHWCATDVLYETTLDGLPALLYLLFEHQSSVDRWIPYRFLRNTDLVWSKALAENPSLERLPVVVPIVLTHARERWWAPMQLQDLVGEKGQLPSCLRDKVPRQSYFLFDLRAMTDGQIVAMATTASLRLLLLILRNVRNPELGAMLRAWHELLGAVVREPSGLRVMELLLTYLAKAVPTMTQETLMQVGQMAGMDPELVEGSLAWRWLEEGRKEGREEGRRETARLVLRLLAKRFGPLPSWVEKRVAASSIEDLDGWSERMIEAASLDEVFG
jgi:predicted transposase/invertase (TIGR01784 family)